MVTRVHVRILTGRQMARRSYLGALSNLAYPSLGSDSWWRLRRGLKDSQGGVLATSSPNSLFPPLISPVPNGFYIFVSVWIKVASGTVRLFLRNPATERFPFSAAKRTIKLDGAANDLGLIGCQPTIVTSCKCRRKR